MESTIEKIRDAFFNEIMPDLATRSSRDFDLKRENGNIDGESAMGTMLRYGSEAAKAFYKTSRTMMSPDIAEAHESGDIHIHDLDFYNLTTTCTQINLGRLLESGFNTGHGYLRPPSNILSAAALAAIAIQSNQNDQHGGQSIPAFDFALAPYVAKSFIKNLEKVVEAHDSYFDRSTLNAVRDHFEKNGSVIGFAQDLLKSEGGDRHIVETALKWTDRDCYQACEAFIHNLNTMHSRAGAQVPFSSINYGTDTSPEGRMVIRNIMLAEEAGLGNGETPIFPIHIFKMRKGYTSDRNDPNYDLFKLACRVSAKRLFPNFSFMDSPFNAQYLKGDDPDHEVAYMGCRTRVMANRYDPSRETTFGRGNLSFTSINLPRLGILHAGDTEGFFAALDSMCALVFRQLLERLEAQSKRKVRNYPFLMRQKIWMDSEKLGLNDEVRDVLRHGTLTLGFIGLAECLKALIGFHHGESKEAEELGIRIVRRMRELCDAEGERTGLNFTLIATPAEGLSGRFVKIDRERFGNMPGVTDRDYYTNSFHVPVYFPISVFRKISIEAPYHDLTNGGHISYVELDGDPRQNLEAFEGIIKHMEASGMGYGSINHPVDYDSACGYTGIIGNECPNCGRKETNDEPFERIRRITGYLVGTLERFNNGKRAEEHDRVKHTLWKIHPLENER